MWVSYTFLCFDLASLPLSLKRKRRERVCVAGEEIDRGFNENK